jgi:hypothetical protein
MDDKDGLYPHQEFVRKFISPRYEGPVCSGMPLRVHKEDAVVVPATGGAHLQEASGDADVAEVLQHRLQRVWVLHLHCNHTVLGRALPSLRR